MSVRYSATSSLCARARIYREIEKESERDTLYDVRPFTEWNAHDCTKRAMNVGGKTNEGTRERKKQHHQ